LQQRILKCHLLWSAIYFTRSILGSKGRKKLFSEVKMFSSYYQDTLSLEIIHQIRLCIWFSPVAGAGYIWCVCDWLEHHIEMKGERRKKLRRCNHVPLGLASLQLVIATKKTVLKVKWQFNRMHAMHIYMVGYKWQFDYFDFKITIILNSKMFLLLLLLLLLLG
jgi:hypothetical protein